MRQLIAVILASTVLSTTPNIVYKQTAEARSLFDSLFPGAAERRRKRILRRRQRERRYRSRQRYLNGGGGSVSVVKAPTFKTYVPTSLRVVALSKLATAFSAHEEKVLAAAAQDVAPKQPEAGIQEAPVHQSVDEDAFVPPTDPLVEKVSSDPVAPVVDAVAVVPAAAAAAAGDAEASPSDTMPQQDPAATTDTTPEAPVVDSQETDTAQPVMRLSAGYDMLQDIELRARTSLGKALIAHYKKKPEFIWVDDQGQINAQANAVLRVLADAETYGLRTEDYALPIMTVSDAADEADLLRAAMAFEFALTSAVLRYMADAQNGLVDPNRISGYHDFNNLAANYRSFAERISTEDNPAGMMLAAHPKDKAFEQMRAELARLRVDAIDVVSVEIAPKTFIRPGDVDFELENVVESIRLNASATLLDEHFDVFAVDHSQGEYSEPVAAMVRDFQKSVGLRADGIVGRKTIAKMSVPDPNVQLNKVLFAMERLRWLPDSLGSTHVFINQPAYRATYVRGGRSHLSMRAIVGKPANQTNFFYDKIEYVEYNPYWGVPRSILVNEMLPKLRNNPGYLDNLGYEVTTERGRRISSYNVDWWSVGSNFPFNVRQPPGSKNALGELKIMFPNKHSIYMHDTPAKQLFKKDQRAFSHGCVRLADPRGMAAAVLGTNVDNVASRLAGGRNKKQQLKREVPVYVSYFTAWPDDSGKVQFFGDIYGRDKALKKALQMEADVRDRASNV